ncbi:MAG: type VI secretion system protein [Gammaproteobacteria bacterium]|jgi:type VI secretion system protein
MNLRLLKRIRNWEEAGVVSASDVDLTELIESVREDLDKLFNTRRGTVLIDENFGLPDYTHLMNGYSAPDSDEIQRDLNFQIRQYETRLSGVNISLNESRSKTPGLRFGLNAQFSHRDQQHEFAAFLQFVENGSITVSL